MGGGTRGKKVRNKEKGVGREGGGRGWLEQKHSCLRTSVYMRAVLSKNALDLKFLCVTRRAPNLGAQVKVKSNVKPRRLLECQIWPQAPPPTDRINPFLHAQLPNTFLKKILTS